MKKLFALIAATLVISACAPQQNFRIEPETLLNASSEQVSFDLSEAGSLSRIEGWIKDDKPTEAELFCEKDEMMCKEAQSILSDNNIPFKVSGAVNAAESVSLIYSRVAARNCKTAGFGCSVSVNTLQMVSDHNHFVRPPLSDLQDAGKAVENYNMYFGNN